MTEVMTMSMTQSILITCKGANRLAETLKAQGMTQKQLAAVTGLSESLISRMVSGERSGRVDSWLKISKALHVRLDDLISSSDEIKYIGGEQ